MKKFKGYHALQGLPNQGVRSSQISLRKEVQLSTSGMTLPTRWESLVEEIIPDLLIALIILASSYVFFG